jgi:hypothetical protein
MFEEEKRMNQDEVKVAKANIEAAGFVSVVSVCMSCNVEYDVQLSGKGHHPDQRWSHGYCLPCGRRFNERFVLCLDTPDIR